MHEWDAIEQNTQDVVDAIHALKLIVGAAIRDIFLVVIAIYFI
jgi:hypothetical protein